MRKFNLWMSVLCSVLLMSSCESKKSSEPQIPIVRLSTVQLASGLSYNTYPGKTQAAEESSIAFKVSGTLERVLVKVGDHVRQGQVVARMDSRDYEVQLNAVKAEYESVKAECERIIALYNDNGTSANNYDKARYGLEQITQKLKHAQDQVNDCEVRAPYDGYVQSIYHESHETISAGMPVMAIFASKGVEVVINVPVVEFNRQAEFNRFTALFTAPERMVQLKLAGISQKANANQLYEMRLIINDDTKDITPGLSTNVNIYYKETDNIPTEVPSSAVFADGEQSYVFVYQDSTLHKTPVRVNNLTSTGMMQVIKGLEAGQKVVSAGVHSLNDGQKARPAATPSKTNVGNLL